MIGKDFWVANCFASQYTPYRHNKKDVEIEIYLIFLIWFSERYDERKQNYVSEQNQKFDSWVCKLCKINSNIKKTPFIFFNSQKKRHNVNLNQIESNDEMKKN